jgi:hypothetical protein
MPDCGGKSEATNVKEVTHEAGGGDSPGGQGRSSSPNPEVWTAAATFSQLRLNRLLGPHLSPSVR